MPETGLGVEIDWRAHALEVLGDVRRVQRARELVPVDEGLSGHGMVPPLTSNRSPRLVTERDLEGEDDEREYAFEPLSDVWTAHWSREVVLGDEVRSVLAKALANR